MSQSMVLFMMFVYRCSPEKASFFAFFFAVYVGCAVIAHKIDGLAGADPSMPLSNSREREVSSSFSKTTQGVFSLLAAVLVKLSLFQQIQGHPNFHLKISFLYILYGF